MNIKYVIIVLGDPVRIFSELIGKYFKKRKIKKKIIIIGNYKLLDNQLKKLNYNLKLRKISLINEAINNTLNVIDVEFKYEKIFDKISSKSNNYINSCFEISLNLLKNNKDAILINGPISKKTFFKKKYLGVTEFLSYKTRSKNEVMLIYNSKFSVSPLTTHIPIKSVSRKVNKNKIINNVIKINNFYKNILNKKAKFAVMGLNPHCETNDNYSEEEKIITPAIKSLKKKKIFIDGPFSADTFFLKKNLNKYNITIGMYHDQVLIPIKTLFNFEAINITLGLPFIRISPDHGPNSNMLGKNKSDPNSFIYAMKFIEKLK